MKLSIHPFAARMAPELALEALNGLKPGSIVLDPMVGSGTVLRQAAELGCTALGFDLDPLAVLMSRVWTTPISDKVIDSILEEVLDYAVSLRPERLSVPWIDENAETAEFVEYWFGEQQQNDLRRLSISLDSFRASNSSAPRYKASNLLRVALSRIIITKDTGASLARDVSHSRPHKTKISSTFEVIPAFEKAVSVIRQRLNGEALKGKTTVRIGDARRLTRVSDNTVDAVLTSPPYLNALDYMRAHRLSLVWLGYSLQELRAVRANSIGAERSIKDAQDQVAEIVKAFGNLNALPMRFRGIIYRYARDLLHTMKEISRVLKTSGQATFVVGNSCLRTVFVRNSEAILRAAELCSLNLICRYDRELPLRNRYLPTPDDGMLGKRMRTETILSFAVS